MTLASTPKAQQLREQFNVLRLDHPRLRIRNAAHALGVSEMELVAAGAGGVQSTLLNSPPQDVFKELGTLGRVMALTRNDWCVHERHGEYEDIRAGKTMGIVLGPDIDLRMFFKHWASTWAVEDNGRRSIQFFDTAGTAIHKVFCTEQTDTDAYRALVEQSAMPRPEWPQTSPCVSDGNSLVDRAPAELRARWLTMKDMHEFHGILQHFKVSRLTALHGVGTDLAQKTGNATTEQMLEDAVAQQIPIMCFVGNRGMVQIHSGPIQQLRRTGQWFNILDPEFNLHLDTTAIAQTWIVNRPSDDGWITSLECYAADGDLITQFFGARKPGNPELTAWRHLLCGYCAQPLAA